MVHSALRGGNTVQAELGLAVGSSSISRFSNPWLRCCRKLRALNRDRGTSESNGTPATTIMATPTATRGVASETRPTPASAQIAYPAEVLLSDPTDVLDPHERFVTWAFTPSPTARSRSPTSDRAEPLRGRSDSTDGNHATLVGRTIALTALGAVSARSLRHVCDHAVRAAVTIALVARTVGYRQGDSRRTRWG